QRQSAPLQLGTQDRFTSCQPFLNDRPGTADDAGYLLQCLAFQVTEKQRNSQLFRQTRQFLVHHREQLRLACVSLCFRLLDRRSRLLTELTSPPRFGPDVQGSLPGDAVQPTGKTLDRESAGLASQGQEDRLEGVFGVRCVAEQAPA